MVLTDSKDRNDGTQTRARRRGCHRQADRGLLLPRCDHYSGGGICRVCRREIAIEEGNAAPTEDSNITTPDHTGQQPLL